MSSYTVIILYIFFSELDLTGLYCTDSPFTHDRNWGPWTLGCSSAPDPRACRCEQDRQPNADPAVSGCLDGCSKCCQGLDWSRRQFGEAWQTSLESGAMCFFFGWGGIVFSLPFSHFPPPPRCGQVKRYGNSLFLDSMRYYQIQWDITIRCY